MSFDKKRAEETAETDCSSPRSSLSLDVKHEEWFLSQMIESPSCLRNVMEVSSPVALSTSLRYYTFRAVDEDEIYDLANFFFQLRSMMR